jgi:ribose transport system ATP-binding protein
MSPRENESTPPALRLEGLTKRFGDTLVLDRVAMTVEAGEVMGFAGSNGSGKSTLVKVLTGVHPPTDVEALQVAGADAELPMTRTEMGRLGIRVVHQSLGLVDELDVTENVAIAGGFAPAPGGGIRWGRTREEVAEVIGRLGVDVSPAARVGDLAAWQRVAVAVARVFYGDLGTTRLVLLDEVTAAMPREEVSRLFDLLGRLTQNEVGILYVTHRFEEIFAIADRVTVIRDGRVAPAVPVAKMSKAQLVVSLSGTPVEQEAPAPPSTDGGRIAGDGVALSLDGVSANLLTDLDLDLAPGEILGVTGRAGCGKSELGRLAFGLQKPLEGTVRYEGYDGPVHPRALIDAGIGYVPPDRKRRGLLTGASIRENLTLPSIASYGSRAHLDLRDERRAAEQAILDFGVLPPDAEAPIDSLSGGNQQKVILARWLIRDLRVLILDDPTEGVDVPTRRDLYESIRKAAAAGMAVLVLTSDAEEVVELCDRAIVLDEGRVTAEMEGEEIEITSLSRKITEGGLTVG